MIYPEVIHGMFVDLRSITLDDAEFSYNIRADKRNRDTVGQLAPSLDAQKDFIRWQMQEPNDYYFVVLNKKGERIGLVGIYDIHDDIGEYGREVNIGEPAERMEVGVILAYFCEVVLHLKKICYVIYANNIGNINNAKKRGGVFIKTMERNGRDALYFEHSVCVENDCARKTRLTLERLYERQQKRNLY
jgi:RimJ/RimL family protein N-acetyltransferase